jgi:histidinol-phosphate phosphatase family protein
MASFLKSVDLSWSLFLDRDGVINKRNWEGYILSEDQFEFLEGVQEAISFFSTQVGHIFVVTNQQGIGKGLMTECNLLDIHRYMQTEIEKYGGKISACYFAPELKSESETLRKPNPGMAWLAQHDFPIIDFQKSIMVGDTDSDIKFGTQLGMKTVRIRSAEKKTIEADLEVDSLLELAHLWK